MALTKSGFDQRFAYIRAFATKDLDYCRFVDEDFRGHSLDTNNKWREQYAGAGAGAFRDDMACGVYRMTTGALATNNGILDRNNIRIVDPSLFPLLCFKAKMVTIADTNIEMRMGLVDVLGTDHCIFQVDASVGGADLDIMINAYKAGVQTHNVDTAYNLTGIWRWYEMYINDAGKPYWWINGTKFEGDDGDIDVTEFFQPYVEIYTENANAKEWEIDFIKGWQKRSLT